MPEKQQDKRFILHPHWKCYFFSYLLAVITIPLLGLGIAILRSLRKKREAFQYVITEDGITALDPKYEHHVDLVDINRIELQQTRFQQFLGIGSLLLVTSASNMRLKGIRTPKDYKQILEKGISLQRNREKVTPAAQPPDAQYKPGTMGKIDYLTGLWQQGLLSNEDFQKERGYLE